MAAMFVVGTVSFREGIGEREVVTVKLKIKKEKLAKPESGYRRAERLARMENRGLGMAWAGGQPRLTRKEIELIAVRSL
jgi:hypothetical protein